MAAFASFPAGGNVGPTIYVNTCFAYSTTHGQKVHNMVHEFGHTLGFRHSNYTQMGETAGTEGAVHVPNTPTSGNASGSVMNGGTALNSWGGFTWSDMSAVSAIYPLPAPSGLTVTNSGGYPLLTWNAATGATGYTINVITYNTVDGMTQNSYVSFVDNTTGTSYLDIDHLWTGTPICSWGSYDDVIGGEPGHFYEYIVRANHPNGISFGEATHLAYIAQPYCR